MIKLSLVIEETAGATSVRFESDFGTASVAEKKALILHKDDLGQPLNQLHQLALRGAKSFHEEILSDV
jgi:hypothetical protein